MTEKYWIYFSLGIASTIPFTLRFIIQWLLSERKQKSYITPLFWRLSIVGDVFLLAHYLLQTQYHLYFIRFITTYFAFRQLRLIKGNAKPFSWKRYCKITFLLGSLLTLIFIARVFYEYGRLTWIQIPVMPWKKGRENISSLWHMVGFVGAFLFTGRLWIQWWQSEKEQKSYLSPAFWWMSILGGSLTLSYAIYIQDIVTAISYGTGLIPYIRNLMLLRKEKEAL